MLAALLLAAGCGGEDEPMASGKVRVGEKIYTVELAMTRGQRQTGLMGRTELAADRGMLFVYPSPRPLKFWMRNCEIPIDILFLDADGKIVNLHEMAVEPDRRGAVSYPSHVPAQYALELVGGTIRREGIKIGQRVELLDVPDPASAEPGP
jgi:hypothetical protein